MATLSYERVVHGLAESPTAWRAQLVTSVVTAEPQAIAHLAGPSIWPLVAAHHADAQLRRDAVRPVLAAGVLDGRDGRCDDRLALAEQAGA